jgi:hypothetical protein
MAAENLHIFVVAADGNRALDLPPPKTNRGFVASNLHRVYYCGKPNGVNTIVLPSMDGTLW